MLKLIPDVTSDSFEVRDVHNSRSIHYQDSKISFPNLVDKTLPIYVFSRIHKTLKKKFYSPSRFIRFQPRCNNSLDNFDF